jgi:uncharacterized protein
VKALLEVRVVARSRKQEISGFLEDGKLKIRLTAPPVEGKANQALIQLLSEVLQLPKSKIEITSGIHNRDKRLEISGVDQESLNRLLNRYRDL